MVQSKNGNSYLIFGLSLLFYILALSLHHRFERPSIIISKQESMTNFNESFLHGISLGNKRLIANIIWIQTLLQSDLERYKGKDLNSWMYLRFRSVSSLEPKFYENYLFGGMFLSIVKDDLNGAADIFERGLRIYPDDYKLNYNAGFNYYFEMGDFSKGLEKLQRIINHPEAPAPLFSIVNKLRYQNGYDTDSLLKLLKQRHDSIRDENLKRKILSDIYAIKAERDLKCLNTKGLDCERLDAKGAPYLYRHGKWVSAHPFKPYRIHLRKK